MLSNLRAGDFLLVHKPLDGKLVHVYDYPELYSIGNGRSSTATVSILPNGSGFGKIADEFSIFM